MRYSLRTLVVVMLVGGPLLAVEWHAYLRWLSVEPHERKDVPVELLAIPALLALGVYAVVLMKASRR
jgi:hypothetical protein